MLRSLPTAPRWRPTGIDTGSELKTLRLALVAACLPSAWIGGAAPAWAQAANAPTSYVFQCTTAQGRKLTSDRLIAECIDREQRIYTQTGVLIRVVPPSLTASERAVVEAKREKERLEQEAKAEDVRRDRQLLQRFSNERSHQRARESALEPAMNATRNTEQRLAQVSEDRKPLEQEAEFYAGRKLPLKLKHQFETLDATEQALKIALKAQADQRARVNDLYDIELNRLKKLWAGAAPGSLGPIPVPATVQAASDPTAPTAVPAPAVPAPKRKPTGGGGPSTPEGTANTPDPTSEPAGSAVSTVATKAALPGDAAAKTSP
jgi:hypothetical protein